MEYKVEKSLLGTYSVHYQCPQCGGELKSPLAEAGDVFDCPTCQSKIKVPGTKEKQQLEARQKHEAEMAANARRAQIEQEANARLAASQKEEEARRRRLLARRNDPSGFADKFLKFAFGFGKYASVVVVAICFLLIVGALVWLPMVQPERPITVVRDVTAPSFAEYLQSLPSTQSGGTPSNVPTSAIPTNSLYGRFQTLLSRYRFNYDFYRESILRDFSSVNVLGQGEMLVSGLESFIKEAGAAKRPVDGEAIYWYVTRVRGAVEEQERDQRRLMDEIARNAAAASAKRQMLLQVVIISVVSLLSFLILPLLIMIEQNTRLARKVTVLPTTQQS